MPRFTLAAFAALATIPLAHAQEHIHPTGPITGPAAKFYETWKQPDNPAASCCNKIDCYATEARLRGGQWYARQRETGEFIPVPPNKVELDRDSPDGLSHVCANPMGVVYCFKAGGGI